jgi:hypothetical protein
MLVKISIPIPNYENNGIFYKELYFQCDKSPSLADVISYCEKMDLEERHMSYAFPNNGPYCFEFSDCLDILRSMHDFDLPRVTSNYLISTNTFVKTNFGKKPLTVEILEICDLTNSSKGE